MGWLFRGSFWASAQRVFLGDVGSIIWGCGFYNMKNNGDVASIHRYVIRGP
jgi:hypothetical protein